jgi:hypothetical protein
MLLVIQKKGNQRHDTETWVVTARKIIKKNSGALNAVKDREVFEEYKDHKVSKVHRDNKEPLAYASVGQFSASFPPMKSIVFV